MRKFIVCIFMVIILWSTQGMSADPQVDRLFQSARELNYQRKYAEAIDTLKKAYSIDSEHRHTLLLLGEVYIKIGNFPGARQAFEQLRAIDPHSPIGYIRLAEIHWHLENYMTAMEYLETAEKLSDPPHAGVFRWMGQVLRSQDKLHESEEILWEGLKYYPDNPEILANYGATLLFLQDGATGSEFIDSAYAVDSLSPFVINSKVSLFLLGGRLDSARHYLDLAVGLAPDNPFTRKNMLSFSVVESEASARQLLREGNQAFTKSLYRRAAEKFSQAVEIDSTFFEAWFNLAFSYIHLGEAEKAAHAFEQGLMLKPDYAPGYIGWGDALIGMLEYEQALDKYKQAMKLDPNNKEYEIIYEEVHRLVEDQKKKDTSRGE
ncbi:MAG: tetratricopeptide repeat protein [candidate division Zixibacteria bacterium]|nr:tetratricopeptide repeat protein [candidate division Zixibacteria bacterium]